MFDCDVAMAGDAALARSWIPADDVLLKNAVEAGASLESLAKGAVDFSRNFTVQELRDRWFSILYDPVVAEEASAHMAQIERVTPDIFAPNFSRLGSVKEEKCDTGKRKAESVRDSYYAQRKRICSGPFDSIDFDSMFAPDESNYLVNGDDLLSDHVMTGDPNVNHFGLDGSNIDDTIHHKFPEDLIHDNTVIDCINTVDTFEGVQKPTEENHLVEQGNLDKENSYIEDYLSITGTGSAVKEFRQPKNLLDSSMFGAGDVGTTHPCSLDQINNGGLHVGSSFNGNQVYSLTASEGTSSYHDLDYSTQLPDSNIWSTDPATSLPVDIGSRENDTCTRDSSEPFDDFGVKDVTTSGYDIDIGHEFPVGDLKCLGIHDDYLEALSHSLLNFTEEEEELMKTNEEALMSENENSKSYYDGLSSLLSPKDDIREVEYHLFEPGSSVMMPPMSSTCADLALTNDIGRSLPDDGLSFHPEVLMQSSPSASNFQCPEYKDGVLCCVLNTEQWEIPCNDDVAFPIHVALSSTACKVREHIEPEPNCASVEDLTFNQRKGDSAEKGQSIILKEKRNPGTSLCILEPSSKQPMSDFELSKSNPVNVASMSTCHVVGNLGQVDSAQAITNPPPGSNTMLNFPGYTKMESHSAHPHLGSDCARSYPQPHATETDWEPDASTTVRDHPSLLTEIAPLDDSILEPDIAGLFESDDDIPHCSDIEAMILEMDLNPDDHEMYSNEEVSRNQSEDSKREIMRLEQGAYSYMQRANASHGALAILYGRHSKHYIKKPEVVLGRTTLGIMVDIDLAREGSGNKVSRQQSTLKLEKDGSFYLKNLGSCSISVNSMELTPGQRLRLSSNCLIEIRSMAFIFEVNQTSVKKYLDSITQQG